MAKLTSAKEEAAAWEAAAWMSRGANEAGRGREWARSGKLRMAEEPLMVRAATSWARAAISGFEKVPSQIRDFFRGCRISDTHFPQLRIRTPLYTGCLLLFLDSDLLTVSSTCFGCCCLCTLPFFFFFFITFSSIPDGDNDIDVADTDDDDDDDDELLLSGSELFFVSVMFDFVVMQF